MAKRINCYVCDDDQIGFDANDYWVLFERRGGHVNVDKFGEVPLGPAECRKIAAWLNRVAEGKKGA